jgi:hypothetical protein
VLSSEATRSEAQPSKHCAASFEFEPVIQSIEATTGFEPVIGVLQTLALPLGYVAWKTKADTVGRYGL